MKIAIVYHSGYGHTKMVAEHIQKGASKELGQVFLLSVLEAQDNFDLLHQANKTIGGNNIDILTALQQDYPCINLKKNPIQ